MPRRASSTRLGLSPAKPEIDLVPIRLEIVTPERAVLEDDVDMVIAPASEGYVGILPHHAPLLTTLGPGELRIKKGGVETSLAIFGGFMDVRPDRKTALAYRWIIGNARKRSGRTMIERLSSELLDAANNTGASVKRKEDTHRMADANKAFAHYRW